MCLRGSRTTGPPPLAPPILALAPPLPCFLGMDGHEGKSDRGKGLNVAKLTRPRTRDSRPRAHRAGIEIRREWP